MQMLRNLWNRKMSEDVIEPELRALCTYDAKVKHHRPYTVNDIHLPRLCFYRDLYRQL